MILYRFVYSPYARKVQMLLDLLGAKYELVDVPYSDRTSLARLTGGYISVPVLVGTSGEVIVDSRVICESLLREPEASRRLVGGAEMMGPVWAYADFADNILEDVLFRIAAPSIRDSWQSEGDRALYVLIKERRYGAGCVEAWEKDRNALVTKGQHLLAPTIQTLARRPFLFGDQPTLADAALYGECAMLEEGHPDLLSRLSEVLPLYLRRVEAAAQTALQRR